MRFEIHQGWGKEIAKGTKRKGRRPN